MVNNPGKELIIGETFQYDAFLGMVLKMNMIQIKVFIEIE